jgi:hypothetical protein
LTRVKCKWEWEFCKQEGHARASDSTRMHWQVWMVWIERVHAGLSLRAGEGVSSASGGNESQILQEDSAIMNGQCHEQSNETRTKTGNHGN